MRSDQVKDYVKKGETSGYVGKLYQANAKNNQNIIRRTIDIHNKSSYRINNKSANATKVKEITQRLNIQVNNLTVFLAQDRVDSFARMSPYELLLETEKAANPQLMKYI